MTVARFSSRQIFLATACAALLGLLNSSGVAQVPTASPSPMASPSPSPRTRTITIGHDDSHPTEHTVPIVDYFFPDLASDVTTIDTKYFKFRLGFAALGDYTFVDQDSASLSQIGPQASISDLRSGRLLITGAFKFKKPWTYYVGLDYNERPSPGHTMTFDAVDYNLTIPLWKKARITVGKQKIPFFYEAVGDAAFLMQQERILNPFYASRLIGIRYSDNFLNDRIALSVGIFNSWTVQKVDYSDGGIQGAARLTSLPAASKDGTKYLHLGAAYRYYGADKGIVRFKGRPESNMIDNYVDTGNIRARHANELAFEALYTTGPVAVLSEYVHSWVKSPSTQNPGFNGFYVVGSYVLTGENRPYDRKAAYARRIIPKSRWGAVEAVARYSYLDLDDTLVKGGTLNKLYFGVNWWASIQWKLGVGYGFSDLNRFDTTGHTNAVLMRVQWVY